MKIFILYTASLSQATEPTIAQCDDLRKCIFDLPTNNKLGILLVSSAVSWPDIANTFEDSLFTWCQPNCDYYVDLQDEWLHLVQQPPLIDVYRCANVSKIILCAVCEKELKIDFMARLETYFGFRMVILDNVSKKVESMFEDRDWAICRCVI